MDPTRYLSSGPSVSFVHPFEFAGFGLDKRGFFAGGGDASLSLDMRFMVRIGRPVFLLTIGLSVLEMLITDALRERLGAIELHITTSG